MRVRRSCGTGGGMFGQSDNNNQQSTDVTSPAADATAPVFTPPATLATPSPAVEPSTTTEEPTASDDAGLSADFSAPLMPAADTSSQDTLSMPTTSSGVADDGDDDLAKIKQDALQDLSPLVKHLDQTPEEKFRTTMMMIQATDDQSQIQAAYDAAKQITDEKVRAQALLDVVNEINYFTQHKS